MEMLITSDNEPYYQGDSMAYPSMMYHRWMARWMDETRIVFMDTIPYDEERDDNDDMIFHHCYLSLYDEGTLKRSRNIHVFPSFSFSSHSYTS
jgi:hypothetical protein